ncbi:hypothetical protein FH972_024878 [Carpinus fangiana]|uniref:Uncharacterized protein n=1 Tax=Carpinus fangiana TaxID=176857 RepID=A0A5N6L0B0_9ROSI|nr:hypothetical protein FH972_024878 [Carpinus fangiana]
MSVSFVTPIKALSSVGFSIGDIAAITGAGRAVGTWIKAKYIDQALLEIADVKDFLPRRSLVNTAELDERWSKDLSIFQDGRLLPLQSQDIKSILKGSSYDGFTWFMTLLTAALTAGTSEECKRWVLLEILSERCDHDEGKEYLLHDADRNFEAWCSIATTRKIIEAARRSWTRLERDGTHQPGLIPFADRQELKRFFLWLTGAGEGGEHSREFRTASSDTISIALVLHDLGLAQLQVVPSLEDVLDSQLAVILDESRVSHGPAESRPKRRGICINMINLEEAISLWPGTAMQNNRRREVFLSAYQSVADVSINAAQLISGNMLSREDFQPLYALEYIQQGRLPEMVSKFCTEYLVGPSHSAGQALNRIVSGWALSETAKHQVLDAAVLLNPELAGEQLAELQIFVTGYYYGLLRPLIDTSRMSVVEAFASWTWNDMEIFQVLRSGRKLHGEPKIPNDEKHRPMAVNHLERTFILKLAAYLFAGATIEQIRNVRRGCCGVKGKFILLDRTLMGDADDISKICQFSLLDIDGTCLPSNSLGLLVAGGQDLAGIKSINERDSKQLNEIVLHASVPDFTSLIEPKWGHDLNAPMITYRRRGRIIHRCDPEAVFNAVFAASSITDVYYGTEGQFRRAKKLSRSTSRSDNEIVLAVPVELEEFDGEKVPLLIQGVGSDSTPLCVATNNLPKIRSCIATIYCQDTSESIHLAHLRKRPNGCSDQALIVDLDSCQVIVK